MKQKTAIRQLIDRLEYLQTYQDAVDAGLLTAISIAKELEPVNEQQIKDAVNARHPMQRVGLNGEDYFNETFEKP